MRKVYFTPGPTELYFTAEHHLKQAFKTGISSISHRSSSFQSIYKAAEGNLKELLSLPDNFRLVFTSSASVIWEKLSDGIIMKRSLHIVNGAFSKKFYTVVNALGKKADLLDSAWGDFPDIDTIDSTGYNLIGLTHNETSTGVKTPLKSIYSLKEQHPEAILAIDAVSSLPVLDIDYTKIDTIYASVQKAFGLPAGLAVWLINDRTEERARINIKSGVPRRSQHDMVSLLDQAINYQTPSTPNILSIYLLSQVVEDMIERGIAQIRNDSVYKAAIMYNMLDQHDILKPFVKDKSLRSETIIVIDSGNRSKDLIKFLLSKNLVVGAGYGKMKDLQVRIANFPTHSKEQFEMLVDIIEKFE